MAPTAPKSPSPARDKPLAIDYKEYMNTLEQMALALNQSANTTSSMMMSSSAALSQITTSMLALQSSTKSFLEKNSLESKPAKLKEYPALADLLGKAQSEITNPMALKDFTKTEKQRTKKPKDPNAPKRPQTAFFLYLNATKPEIKKDHPDLSAGPIAKLATERWNVASEEVKQAYKDIYIENYRKYCIATGKPMTSSPPKDADEAADEEDDDAETDSEESANSDEEEDDTPAPLAKEPTPPPAKTPKPKKAKKAAAEKKKDVPVPTKETSPAKTPAKAPGKGKKAAKAASPEAATAAAVADVETPATEKKKNKRKSIGGAEAEERKKKRRETHGDDF